MKTPGEAYAPRPDGEMFCDHQPSLRGTPPVILRHKIGGHVARHIRTHPGKWRKDHAMREIERTNLDWRKQLRHLSAFVDWVASSAFWCCLNSSATAISWPSCPR